MEHKRQQNVEFDQLPRTEDGEFDLDNMELGQLVTLSQYVLWLPDGFMKRFNQVKNQSPIPENTVPANSFRATRNGG